MTARPFCGWQMQDNGPSVQGALEDAVKAICGEQVRVHGAGRTDAGVHALAQVAHCDLAKHFVPDRLRDGAERASAAASDRRAVSGDRAGDVRGAVLGEKAPLPLPHPQPPRQPRARRRPRLARAAAARHRRRCTRPRSGLSASTTSPPFATPNARRNRRRRRSTSSTSSRRRRRQHRDLGALVPAQPGALDGRLAGLGRRGPLERATISPARWTPATAPPAARSRRRTDSIWCGWIIALSRPVFTSPRLRERSARSAGSRGTHSAFSNR